MSGGDSIEWGKNFSFGLSKDLPWGNKDKTDVGPAEASAEECIQKAIRMVTDNSHGFGSINWGNKGTTDVGLAKASAGSINWDIKDKAEYSATGGDENPLRSGNSDDEVYNDVDGDFDKDYADDDDYTETGEEDSDIDGEDERGEGYMGSSSSLFGQNKAPSLDWLSPSGSKVKNADTQNESVDEWNLGKSSASNTSKIDTSWLKNSAGHDPKDNWMTNIVKPTDLKDNWLDNAASLGESNATNWTKKTSSSPNLGTTSTLGDFAASWGNEGKWDTGKNSFASTPSKDEGLFSSSTSVANGSLPESVSPPIPKNQKKWWLRQVAKPAWVCSVCNVTNPMEAKNCGGCGSKKPTQVHRNAMKYSYVEYVRETKNGSGGLFNENSETWWKEDCNEESWVCVYYVSMYQYIYVCA